MSRRRQNDRVGELLTALQAITEVAARAARGDLQARLGPLGLASDDEAAERAVRSALNGLLDVVDAYTRETSAAIVAASERRFHRRLVEGGLHGVFLDGARVIESGRIAMEAAQDTADAASQARHELAARLETALVGLSEDMTHAATTMSTTARSAADFAARARTDADSARSTVESLRDSTGRIREAVDLITRIADQTRLLALNATIEAARAGDTGRGFAVVAGEVKALADESGQSSQSIIAGVTAVGHAVESTVTALGEVTERIGEISDRVQDIANAVEGATAADTDALLPAARRLRQEVDGFVDAIRATERRGAPRTDVSSPVCIEADGKILEGTLHNISLTGAAFHLTTTTTQIRPGDPIRLTIPTAAGNLDCTSTVTRVHQQPDGTEVIAARIVYKRPPFQAALAELLGQHTKHAATS